jgi:exosortase A-associated hydrolase 2
LNSVQLDARFIDTEDGRLFVVDWSPRAAISQGAVMVVAPLGEEMNKSRKLFSDLGCALAQAGFTLIVADLIGTGDSDGDFEDASMDLWVRNLDAVADWAVKRGLQIDGLLGVRFGCLLAAHWLRARDRRVPCTVFWQPVVDGNQIVRQWLRLRVAASMFDGKGKTTNADLERRLNAGESIDVAGYSLTAEFARELRLLDLTKLLGDHVGRLHVFEIGDPDECSAAVQRMKQEQQAYEIAKVPGDTFWAATEIVRNSHLVTRTAESLATVQA